MTAAIPKDVDQAFRGIDAGPRGVLMQVRTMIFELAEANDVGPLTETLKWGQPSYLTEKSKAGSTIRLGVQNGQPAVFFNCNTRLVDGFRSDFPTTFDYSGNRALLLDGTGDQGALAICLRRALTYHRDKKKVRA